LAADIPQLLRLGIDIDQLDLIDDPIAPGQEAATGICASRFHAVGAQFVSSSERKKGI
jgi:hypothetical protein